MKIGDKVRLVQFDGLGVAPRNTWNHENYWKLLGETGVVAAVVEQRRSGIAVQEPRVLIIFDKNMSQLGLECHNETPNALWILASDLEEVVT
jgi:hypothetical protein